MGIGVLDNDFASVWVYPDKRIIHHRFKRFMYGEPFRNVLLKATEAFEKNGCTKWLSDDRENSSLSQNDIEWAYDVWEPRILKAGWKHWALVLPKKIFGELTMKKIADRYALLGVNVRLFYDANEAMEWLEKQ